MATDAKVYADQVRGGVVLSVRNLADFIEELGADRDRLRKALTEIARYASQSIPQKNRLPEITAILVVAREALAPGPEEGAA